MHKLTFSKSSLLIAFLLLTASAHAEDGVIGATCLSTPFCPKSSLDGTDNACSGVGKQFYPGVLMLAAKQAAVNRCKTANALDYCGAFAGPVEQKIIIEKFGGCADQCETMTTCIYGDNQ